jgi:hypothetical protein
MSTAVNVENFVRAESDRMFGSFVAEAGGVNRLLHHRAPTPVDHQPVIRMNRDTLTVDEFDTPWVGVAARILVDPADEDDVAAVNALQDGFVIEAASSKPFEAPDFDTASLDATRGAILELARGMRAFDHAFGSRSDVDPVRHLLGTAAGWGGLPDLEARYIGVEPRRRRVLAYRARRAR